MVGARRIEDQKRVPRSGVSRCIGHEIAGGNQDEVRLRVSMRLNAARALGREPVSEYESAGFRACLLKPNVRVVHNRQALLLIHGGAEAFAFADVPQDQVIIHIGGFDRCGRLGVGFGEVEGALMHTSGRPQPER